MLVLTRKCGEDLFIGDNVIVKIIDIKGGRVQLGIEAPNNIRIRRTESCQPATVVPVKNEKPNTTPEESSAATPVTNATKTK